MAEQALAREALLIHLLTWWGIRVLSARLTYQVVFADTPMQAAAWWAVRLLRAIAMIAIVAVWAHRRHLSWQTLGLGKPHFWRTFILSVGGMAALWIAIGSVYHVWPRDPTGIGLRATSALVCFVDVLAQQLSTFGLLQGVLAPRRGPLLPFGLAWLSFGIAHFIIMPPLMVWVSFIAGTVFGALMWRTKNLGGGIGVHFGFYLMRSVLGWEVQML